MDDLFIAPSPVGWRSRVEAAALGSVANCQPVDTPATTPFMPPTPCHPQMTRTQAAHLSALGFHLDHNLFSSRNMPNSASQPSPSGLALNQRSELARLLASTGSKGAMLSERCRLALFLRTPDIGTSPLRNPRSHLICFQPESSHDGCDALAPQLEDIGLSSHRRPVGPVRWAEPEPRPQRFRHSKSGPSQGESSIYTAYTKSRRRILY